MIQKAKDSEHILQDGKLLEHAILTAQRRTVLRHRQMGIPLVIWRDGQVVEVPAESVDLPETDPPGPAR